MKTSQIATAIVTIIVGIVLVSVLAVPIINDGVRTMTAVETEQIIESPFEMDVVTSYEITYAGSTTKEFTINGGEPFKYTLDQAGLVVFASDKVICRTVVVSSSTYNLPTLAFWTIDNKVLSLSNANYDYVLTLENGTITLSSPNSPQLTEELVYTDVGTAYGVVDDGKYLYAKSDQVSSLVVNKGDVIIPIDTGGWWGPTVLNESVMTATEGEVTVDATVYTNANPPVEYDGTIAITFTDIGDDCLSMSNAVASYNSTTANMGVIAPLTYTTHEETTVSTIVNVIPVLLGVSLVIGAVAMFITTKRD